MSNIKRMHGIMTTDGFVPLDGKNSQANFYSGNDRGWNGDTSIDPHRHLPMAEGWFAPPRP